MCVMLSYYLSKVFREKWMMQQILEQDSKHEAWSYHVWADNLLANENRIENDTNVQKYICCPKLFLYKSSI